MDTRWRIQQSSEPHQRQSQTMRSVGNSKELKISETFECWNKNISLKKPNSKLTSTRVSGKGVLLWIFASWIALCILGSSIADAKAMCGSRLTDKLIEICGTRGISRPVVGAALRGGRRVANVPPDIISMCCRRSCTMKELSQYCGGGQNSHYLNIIASMKRDPSRRRRPASRRGVDDGSVRDDDRALTRTTPSPNRQSRRHVIARNRYLHMTLQEFLRQRAESYVREHGDDSTDSEDVLLALAKSYLQGRARATVES